jgi:hypothetical protein
VANRYKHAEFTHPYTESGLVMIVPVQSKTCNKASLFLKPFTKAMWVLIGAINVYNGFVVWLIERHHWPMLKGSALNQMLTLLCLSFTTLFSLKGNIKSFVCKNLSFYFVTSIKGKQNILFHC